jgi:hypothetical protein
MYFSTACGLAASLAVVSAAPLQARTDFTTITFNGAAGANYQLSVPLDGSQTDTSKPNPSILSILSTNNPR